MQRREELPMETVKEGTHHDVRREKNKNGEIGGAALILVSFLRRAGGRAIEGAPQSIEFLEKRGEERLCEKNRHVGVDQKRGRCASGWKRGGRGLPNIISERVMKKWSSAGLPQNRPSRMRSQFGGGFGVWGLVSLVFVGVWVGGFWVWGGGGGGGGVVGFGGRGFLFVFFWGFSLGLGGVVFYCFCWFLVGVWWFFGVGVFVCRWWCF